MSRLRTAANLVLIAAIGAVGAGAASAANVFWIGNSAGSWNTAANWEDENAFNAVPFGNSPFFDQAYIGNGSTITLTTAASNNIDALIVGGQSSRDDGINPIVYGSGGLVIGAGGSLDVSDNGGAPGSGNVNIGRVPTFGAPEGTTATDAQAGSIEISGNGSLSVANRLFLERRNNVNPALTLQDTATLAVSGQSDLRGTARITGPNVNFSTGTLDFGGRLRLIPEIAGPTHSAIDVTGTALLNTGATVAPEISGPLSGGEQYVLIDAATVTDNGVVLDDSQIPLGTGQRARLFVDRTGATEKYTLGIDNVLTLNVNRLTGAVAIDNTHGSGIDIKGYSIQSPSGKLAVGDWQSFDAAGTDGGTWEEANPTANALNELNLTSFHTFADASSTGFGSPYSLSELGEEDDLSFTYQTAGGESLTGLIEYTGGFNTIVLRVDPATGDAVITNESQFSAEINGYSITSGDGTPASGSLLTSWNSLDQQGTSGWEEANPTSEALNELSLDDSLLLNTGDSISLDGLWNTGGNQDLSFRFGLLGGVGTIDGVVLYEAAQVDLLGDADGDGDVDGDDLIAVQTEFGSIGATPLLGDADSDGDVDGDDLIAVQTNFGSVASTAVPEPTASALLLLLGVGRLARGRH